MIFFLKLKLPKKHHHFSQTFFWVIFHIDCHDFPKGMDLDFWKSLKATFEAGYDKPPARRVREWLAGSPWVSFQVVYSRNLRLVNCGVFFRFFFWGGWCLLMMKSEKPTSISFWLFSSHQRERLDTFIPCDFQLQIPNTKILQFHHCVKLPFKYWFLTHFCLHFSPPASPNSVESLSPGHLTDRLLKQTRRFVAWSSSRLWRSVLHLRVKSWLFCLLRGRWS